MKSVTYHAVGNSPAHVLLSTDEVVSGWTQKSFIGASTSGKQSERYVTVEAAKQIMAEVKASGGQVFKGRDIQHAPMQRGGALFLTAIL